MLAQQLSPATRDPVYTMDIGHEQHTRPYVITLATSNISITNLLPPTGKKKKKKLNQFGVVAGNSTTIYVINLKTFQIM